MMRLWQILRHAVYALRRRVVLAYWFWRVRGYLGPIQHLVDIGPGIRPQTRLKAKRVTLVEPYAAYAAKLRDYVQRLERFGYELVEMTAQDYAEQTGFTGAVVVSCDMIEHLDKADGLTLIKTMQQTADAIVLYTPLGFMPQDHDPWGLGGEHWQLHRSGWTPADFPGWCCLVDASFHGDQGMGAFLAVWRRAWATKS